MALARTAQGYAQGQGKERSQRRGPQTLEAEGHGTRACGLDSLASLASWRHSPWTEATRLQLRSALSAKLAEQKLTVVDAWTLETHKTKALLEVLNKLNHTKSALLVAHGENANLERASRNIEGVTLSAPSGLQPYDVLKHDLLLLSKDAVMRLTHSLDPEKKPVVVPDVESIAPAAKPVKKEAAPKAATKKPAAKKTAKSAKKKGKG